MRKPNFPPSQFEFEKKVRDSFLETTIGWLEHKQLGHTFLDVHFRFLCAQADLRRSASTEDVAGHPRGIEDPGRRFRIDLERIGSMYAAKNRRLEVQLSQAK